MPSPLATQRATTSPSAPSTSGVPAPLRAAFELMIAHDSRWDPQGLREKALSFLKATRDLAAEPEPTFADAMVTHCLKVLFSPKKENKALTEIKSSELPHLSQRIHDGFRKIRLAEFYHSLSGTLAMDVKGVRAFQRDYIGHLDDIISSVERASEVPENLLKPIDQLAGFVLGFCRKKRAPSPNRKGASAHDISMLLYHAERIDLPTLQLAISTLTQRDGLESLKAAINPIVSRARGLGVVIPPEAERELSDWAKRSELLAISKLGGEDRDALVSTLRVSTRQLLKGECGALMELDWMASVQDAQRDFEYLYDKADINPAKSDQVPEYPEVNYRFARALRLTMPELNDLKRASEFLEREGLADLRVEMDQSPFLWPRIAETILFAKPSEIALHSPTALEPFEAPTEKAIKPFLCQRTMHVIPVTLTTSPKEIIEQEVHLAGKGSVEWASSVRGEASLGDQKISMTIEPNMRVSDAVQAFAPHIKPNSNSFIIRDPKAAPSAPPRAFGVFFSERSPSLPGHTTHAFGKTVCLFVAQAVKEVEAAALPQTLMPTVPAAVEPPAPPLTSTTLPIIEQNEVTLPATPTAPEQPAPPTPKAEVMVPKKVKKAPPPPPVKEPRPRISDEHAQVAKEVVAALPEIQTAARSSRALKPEVPFTDPEMATTLHILKNGEKPGTRKLKALREYVLSEGNFRDAMGSSTLRAARQRLGALLDTLLS